MGTLTTHIFKNAISNQPRSVVFRDRKNLRTEGFTGLVLYFEDSVSLKSEHRVADRLGGTFF